MDKDSALRKIKKCLQLSKSSNPTEAAAALRQARQLMAEYGIGQSDAGMFDIGEGVAKMPTTAIVLWQTKLAHAIGDTFGCDFFMRLIVEPLFGRSSRDFVFVGAGGTQDVASYAFEVLARQCTKARAAHVKAQRRNCKPITKTARGDAFAMGWVLGVEELLADFAGCTRPADAIQAYIKHKHPDMRQAKPLDRLSGTNVRPDDVMHGHRAGRNAQLHRGIGGVEPRALLTGGEHV